MIKKSLTLIVLLAFAASVFAQESPSADTKTEPTAEQKIQRLEEEILLLKKQQELEKAKSELSNRRLTEIMEAMPKNSAFKSLDGKTEFQDDKDSNIESIALSFEALKEVTARINQSLKADISRYSGIVIYYGDDFLALAKYRVYRSQLKIALRNYDLLAANVEKLNKENRFPETTITSGKFGTKGISPVMMALSLPSIGTSYAKSVAELFSVFRTDTTLTQSRDTIDNLALGTAMTNELLGKNPNLKIFYPQAFIPEYDLENEGGDSLFTQIAKVNEAKDNLEDLSSQVGKIAEVQRATSPLRETISFAEMIKKQMQSLTISDSVSNAAARGENNIEKKKMSDFRELVRAEKLDRFLRGSRDSVSSNQNQEPIGILKLRMLSSGGSRRETRNLFFGNKITFSGSAIIEVLLFDADGTLRASNIFSLHTGFRKMEKTGK